MINEPGIPLSFDSDLSGIAPQWSQDEVAGRLTSRHKEDLRYVAVWRRWMLYRSGSWHEDSVLTVFDRARMICREEARCALLEGKEPLARQLSAAATVSAVERMASWDPRTAATTEQWDANLWDLNTPTDTCELRTGIVRGHRAEDYMTRSTSVSAAPTANCPRWLQFLDRITGQDRELQNYLRRVAGYCLTGETREHALFFLYGVGANGKTTFTNTLLGILSNYAQVAQMETFTENKNDRHPTDLAALRGARLVVASETEQNARWAESRIKALTGGEPVRARFMRCDEFEYRPQFKLMIQGNHKPGLRSVDEAIRRRLQLIPFAVTIPPGERDPELGDKLKLEWPEIIRWMLDGCLEWQKDGLKPPQAVIDATEQYLETEDAVGCWLGERATVSPQAGTAKTSSLYQDFKLWADGAGEFVLSQKKFSQALERRGFKGRQSNGIVVDGIQLRHKES